MKLEIKQGDEVLSSIIFYDATIAEIVTFWTNVKYQSPQFPLDLTPNVLQEGDLYPEGKIPTAELGKGMEFIVTNGEVENPIEDIEIIQVKLNFIGNELLRIPDKSDWETYFKTGEKVVYAPDGSAYISPKESLNSVKIDQADHQSAEKFYFSYSVLIAFKIDNTTYYGNFDPIVKISSGKEPEHSTQ